MVYVKCAEQVGENSCFGKFCIQADFEIIGLHSDKAELITTTMDKVDECATSELVLAGIGTR